MKFERKSWIEEEDEWERERERERERETERERKFTMKHRVWGSQPATSVKPLSACDYITSPMFAWSGANPTKFFFYYTSKWFRVRALTPGCTRIQSMCNLCNYDHRETLGQPRTPAVPAAPDVDCRANTNLLSSAGRHINVSMDSRRQRVILIGIISIDIYVLFIALTLIDKLLFCWKIWLVYNALMNDRCYYVCWKLSKRA